MARHFWVRCLVFKVAVFIIFSGLTPSVSLAQSSDSCNGIFLSYVYNGGRQLPPNVSDSAKQPHRFESTLTVVNNGLDELQSWKVFVGFQHDEYLVSASNAVIAAGDTLPADVRNGTILSGFPVTDLKTAAETAGDLTQMQVQINLVGTQYGVEPPAVPLPSNITLANDGFVCPKSTGQGNETHVCCTKDPNFKTSITTGQEFLPRQSGDLTIMYDVTSTSDSDYWAEVTISNHNPLGRLDNWRLSWDWMRQEFINAMKGAYPSVVDPSECIFGGQGGHYKEFDFSKVLSCEKSPTIIDLPPTMFNDSNLGKIPFCCRNGTILPPSMDPSKSSSRFQMQVYKMPPDLNRSVLNPPQNWKISGTLNPDYKCGPPIRVSPSEKPDPSGLPSNISAIASWQVVCNITRDNGAARKCCVSFSGYYNESVIPCKTCACGCTGDTGRTCSASTPAMLLPANALLVPFENRSELAVSWADTNHFTVPNPMPCGDNCGVTINWHVLTDYTKGWTARISLFNWDETAFADWFVAVEMNKAGPGFEKMYSFNASALEGVMSNTIMMQGASGNNYLLAETDGHNPEKDPRVPGKQQSVISFTKKNTPGINVVGGDGFPTKVFFNGEECSLPSVFPSSGFKKEVSLFLTLSVPLLFIILMKF
ncbi:hypothetical protein QN277_000360 [Acacia crassicarpa]|uniref:COBRA C-terminal domain-containing protein n=1 Tax=Acacia crassicarpa TaxID=499986 RepID=A0AAE1N522_9FABA|nr:hypothetical protein QN277_000360 [Acacia crassicarpa]